MKEYNIGGFILGFPLSLDGNENEQTVKIRKFSIDLQSFFSVPFEFWDERYSSDVVFKELRKSDFSSSKIKKKLDLIVDISMTNNMESLNESVATAIAMHEIFIKK